MLSGLISAFCSLCSSRQSYPGALSSPVSCSIRAARLDSRPRARLRFLVKCLYPGGSSFQVSCSWPWVVVSWSVRGSVFFRRTQMSLSWWFVVPGVLLVALGCQPAPSELGRVPVGQDTVLSSPAGVPLSPDPDPPVTAPEPSPQSSGAPEARPSPAESLAAGETLAMPGGASRAFSRTVSGCHPSELARWAGHGSVFACGCPLPGPGSTGDCSGAFSAVFRSARGSTISR